MTPNRGLGPPWGAFCQITVTSCSFCLTLRDRHFYDILWLTGGWHCSGLSRYGIFSSRSDVLELTAQKLAWPVTYCCCFWTITRKKKHFFSQSTSVHSASEAFATMRYINWCFTYFTRYVLTQHSATIQRLWQSLCSLVKIVAKQTCPAPGVKVHRSSALVRLLSWLSLFLHVGLGSAAAWRHSTFIKWTGWTLAMALPWWQHHKHCLGYYIILYYCTPFHPCHPLQVHWLLRQQTILRDWHSEDEQINCDRPPRFYSVTTCQSAEASDWHHCTGYIHKQLG